MAASQPRTAVVLAVLVGAAACVGAQAPAAVPQDSAPAAAPAAAPAVAAPAAAAPAVAPAAGPVAARAAGAPAAAPAAGAIVISEFLADPAPTSLATTKKPSDWVELLNAGAAPVSLGGWTLVAGNPESSKSDRWQLPAVDVPPGGYLVLIEAGRAGNGPASQVEETPGGPRLLPVSTFKIGKEGEALTLLRPDGSVASTNGQVPPQKEGATFGVPAGAPAGSPLTFLQAPTPGAPNSPPVA